MYAGTAVRRNLLSIGMNSLSYGQNSESLSLRERGLK